MISQIIVAKESLTHSSVSRNHAEIISEIVYNEFFVVYEGISQITRYPWIFKLYRYLKRLLRLYLISHISSLSLKMLLTESNA